MNKVVVVGRLTKDPELRNTNSGMSVVTFSVAVNRTFKNKDGNYDTDFINCVIFGRQAMNVSKYCFKGSQVAVEGRIQTRNYDAQDGTKRYVTEIVADNVEFLGNKKDSNSSSEYIDTPSMEDFPVPDSNQNDGIDVSSEDPFKDFGNEVTLSDDDLPF